MTLDINKIDAIIFDLGGVIINLDTNATVAAFAKLSGKSFEEISNAYEKADFFKTYEVGAISDAEFRAAIRKSLDITASDQLIDEAWNAMLLEIPFSRISAFKKLKKDFKLFVMSNTNHIHIRKFNEIFEALNTGDHFTDYFDKVYYSQEIAARKPNSNAWTPILAEYNLEAQRALFIDDRLDNIEAAKKLGLLTFHNQELNDWLSLLR
jgi:putative hydrolase of the HAD superfamily